MNRVISIHQIHTENTYSDLDILLYKICFHGAPTLKRVKPASLICFKNSPSVQLKDIWDCYKPMIEDAIPCDFKEIKRCDEGVNVLFFWNNWLERIIKTKKIAEYLGGMGYKGIEGTEDALNILAEHFENGCPHEVGVFLGYPLSDVIAFSSNKKQECIGVGYWKVYSNMQRAKKIFELYDNARFGVVDCLQRGIKPDKILKTYA